MPSSGHNELNTFISIGEQWEKISMALHKTAVTPLLMHWSYHSLVLSHQYLPHLHCCWLLKIKTWSLNWSVPGRSNCNLRLIIFKVIPRKDILSFSYQSVLYCPQANATWLHWWFNDVVLSGNKPLPADDTYLCFIQSRVECHYKAVEFITILHTKLW